eukprot:gene47636-64594_t
MASINPITGGGGDDKVSFSGAAQNVTIDLEAGDNRIALDNYLNILTISNVTSVTGGSVSDVITLLTDMTGGYFSLGAGSDSLTFNGGMTATMNAVETINGAAADDAITLGANYAGAEINLGGGTDYLTFAGAGTATIGGVEQIMGSTG